MEQQMQPQHQETQESYIRGMQQQADSSFLMYQLETEEILEEVEMNLKGFDWDPKEKGFVKKRSQMVNDEGISVIMTMLKSEVNKTKILSDFDDKEIAKIMIDFLNNLVDVLASKYKAWEIDPKYLSSIRIMLDNSVHATYKRALDGGERRFLKGETKRVETYSEKEKPNNVISSMFGKRGRW